MYSVVLCTIQFDGYMLPIAIGLTFFHNGEYCICEEDSTLICESSYEDIFANNDLKYGLCLNM